MTQEQLLLCKQDCLEVYKEYLCEESLDAINKAATPEEFVRILHQFAIFLAYKAIPKADWVRKWFNNEKDLLNQCGVYLDQIVSVNNPKEKSIVLLGMSDMQLLLSDADIWNVTVQDDSQLKLVLQGVVSCNVREKGTKETQIVYKDRFSRVKIRRV